MEVAFWDVLFAAGLTMGDLTHHCNHHHNANPSALFGIKTRTPHFIKSWLFFWDPDFMAHYNHHKLGSISAYITQPTGVK